MIKASYPLSGTRHEVKALLCLACVYLCSSVALAASAIPLTTGADFLLMTTGARPDGMGQAFSAVADDINTLTFNPAGLGNVRLPEVGFGYESYVAGINYDFVGSAVPVGTAGVLGLGYISMGTAPFNSTANPSAITSSANDWAVVAGWGKSFYNLQVGVAGKYISRQLDTVQGNGWGFDVGLRYHPIPRLALAISGMNIGYGVKLASLESLPTLVNTGVAYSLLESPNYLLNLAGNGAFNIANNTQQFSLGAEFTYKEMVSLRAGYLVNSLDTTFNPDGFSAGAGVRISFFQLDYAFQPLNTLGMVHRFSGVVRWDGPWVSGGEPNQPKYVNVHQTPKSLEIRWEKALGPAEGYEVVVQPMDGREAFVSKPVVNPYYEFAPIDPGTLYKVSVRTVGVGGVRSYPSEAKFYETQGIVDQVQKLYSEKGNEVAKLSKSDGVNAEVDGVGLRLYWKPPTGMEVAGYNLYRKSPDGPIEKVTYELKKDPQLWITDTSGLEGYKWVVTAVDPQGKEEQVGSYLWFPTVQEKDSLNEAPILRLHASAEPDHKVYLDWDQAPNSSSYSLFVSHKADNVYQYLGDVTKTKATLLLKGEEKNDFYYFIIVPNDLSGNYMRRSHEAKVELTI